MKHKFITNIATLGIVWCMLAIPGMGNAKPEEHHSHEMDPSRVQAQQRLIQSRLDTQVESMNAQGQGPKGIVSQDVDVDGDGQPDIAVLVDDGTLVLQPKDATLLDLQPGFLIRFTPQGGGDYLVETGTGAVDLSNIGPNLGLGDDDAQSVALPFSFPYIADSYSEMFVGSDGHITFEAPEGSSANRNAGRHIGGPPRVSPLLTDLDATCAGSIHANALADRAIVTWKEVPQWSVGSQIGCDGSAPDNTFQAILYNNGTIELVYGDLDTVNIGGDPNSISINPEAVTGLAEGGNSGEIHEVDYTALTSSTFNLGNILEEYTPPRPKSVSDLAVAQAFYKTHPDHFDYLVHYEDFANASGGLAHYTNVQNQTFGINGAVILELFDHSGLFGSDGELEGIVYMNNIDVWTGRSVDDYINPPLIDHRSELVGDDRDNTNFEDHGYLDLTLPNKSTGYSRHGRHTVQYNKKTLNQGLMGRRIMLDSHASTLWQELTHRWGASYFMLHPVLGFGLDEFGIPSFADLLGRGFVHWSAFLNTRIEGSPFTAEDGMPRISDYDGNASIELELDDDGNVVDKDNPARIIDDPAGKLKLAIENCSQQTDQALGTTRSAFLSEPDQLKEGGWIVEQYLMGIVKAEDVPPFWYVDGPTSPQNTNGESIDDYPANVFRGSLGTEDDLIYCGTRVDLTVVDNIEAVGVITGNPLWGPRFPVIGDENDLAADSSDVSLCTDYGNGCADVKTSAFILVTEPGSQNRDKAIIKVNEARKAWQEYSNKVIGNRNADGVVRDPSDPNYMPKFDTSLNPAIH